MRFGPLGRSTLITTIGLFVGGCDHSFSATGGRSNPPWVHATEASVDENQSVRVEVAGTSPDQLPLTFEVVKQGDLGTATVVDSAGVISYTPHTNAFGTDTFTFRATDGDAFSQPAVVTVTINRIPKPLFVMDGAYDSSGLWELTGPLNEHRGLGDMTADLIVDSIVQALNLPSALEAQARTLVADLIAADIEAYVDANTPAELAPDSELMVLLGTTLAEATVTSTLQTQQTTDDEFTVTEELDSISVDVDGQSHSLPLEFVGSTWTGTRTDLETYDVTAYDIEIDFAEIIVWLVVDVLGHGQTLDHIEAQIREAMDCSQLIPLITGGNSKLEIQIGGFLKFSVDVGKLDVSCQGVQDVVASHALGLFDVALIEMEGSVVLTDADNDQIAEVVESAPGYGGPILVGPIPPAVAPRVTTEFAAVAP